MGIRRLRILIVGGVAALLGACSFIPNYQMVSAFFAGVSPVVSGVHYCTDNNTGDFYRISGAEKFSDVNNNTVSSKSIGSEDPRLDGDSYSTFSTLINMGGGFGEEARSGDTVGAGTLRGTINILREGSNVKKGSLSLVGTVGSLLSFVGVGSQNLNALGLYWAEGVATGRVNGTGDPDFPPGQVTANFEGLYIPALDNGDDSAYILFLGPLSLLGGLNVNSSTEVGALSPANLPAVQDFLQRYAPDYASENIASLSSLVDSLNGATLMPATRFVQCRSTFYLNP
ncbi:MAG: hypothetical protein ABR600_02200 [Actinomycetota bacterium]